MKRSPCSNPKLRHRTKMMQPITAMWTTVAVLDVCEDSRDVKLVMHS